MSYLLGVDAGNTKTLALVARCDGTIVGCGRGGCGDIYGAASAEAALQEVERAVEEALRAAGISGDELLAGGFSMAGADWPEDYAVLREAMEQRGYGRQVTVVNDALGALRAGSPDGTGVAVVCGTGTATGARSPGGATWHTSFWQEYHGSGELARRALRAVLRAELGIDPPTALRERVLAAFGQESVEEVLHLLTKRGREEMDLTSMTRLLLDEAGRGDETAQKIVREVGTGLGDYALAAARRVGIESTPFTLVLAGGVFRHPSTVLADALIARVRAASPGAKAVNSRFEPVVGGLFLAFDAAGMAVDEQVIARLLETMPPAEFFAT